MRQPPPDRRFLTSAALLLGLALLIRLALFIGYQGHDDRTYIAYAWSFAHGGDIVARGLVDPWIGRIGAWLPMATAMAWWGGTAFALSIYSMLTSLGSLVLLLWFGQRLFGARTALLAGLLFALLPIDVFYATRSFADQAVGFWCVAALAAFLLALEHPRAAAGVVAGLCFGIAYLTKETALLMLLPFAAMLWQRRTFPTRTLGFAVLGFALVVCIELLFWQLATQDPLFRWHSTLGSRSAFVPEARSVQSWFDLIPSPIPSEIFRSNNTLIDAALMVLTNEEWGFLYYLVLPLAAFALFRGGAAARSLAIFIWAMLLLLLFVPLHFPNYTLGRDPRFFTMLSVPALLLLADWLYRLSIGWRRGIVAFLLLTWLPCLYVGYVSSDISTQRQLAQYVKAHRSERIWMNSVVASDVIVLSGFDPGLDIGILTVRNGKVGDAPGLIPSNPVRALRADTPVALTRAQLDGQLLIVPQGTRIEPHWRVVAQFEPAPDRLSAFVRRLLLPVLPASLVEKIAPSQGQIIRLYRA